MTTLSIAIPDKMAQASKQAAKSLGVSRTEFIRQAISHELEIFYKQLSQEKMANTFRAMKKDEKYQTEAEMLLEDFDTNLLPEERDNWWSK